MDIGVIEAVTPIGAGQLLLPASASAAGPSAETHGTAGPSRTTAWVMWPETPRVWLDLGAPAHGGSPRVPWAQVIMLEKEIPDLVVTQFPAKQGQCQGFRGHHAASHEMARRSSVLPSKMLANRVVAGAQEGGDHSGPWRVGAEVRFWVGLKAEPMGLLMDWLGY